MLAKNRQADSGRQDTVPVPQFNTTVFATGVPVGRLPTSLASYGDGLPLLIVGGFVGISGSSSPLMKNERSLHHGQRRGRRGCQRRWEEMRRVTTARCRRTTSTWDARRAAPTSTMLAAWSEVASLAAVARANTGRCRQGQLFLQRPLVRNRRFLASVDDVYLIPRLILLRAR